MPGLVALGAEFDSPGCVVLSQLRANKGHATYLSDHGQAELKRLLNETVFQRRPDEVLRLLILKELDEPSRNATQPVKIQDTGENGFPVGPVIIKVVMALEGGPE